MDVSKSLQQSTAALQKLVSDSTAALESLTILSERLAKGVPANLDSSVVRQLELNILEMSKCCLDISNNIMDLQCVSGIPWVGSQLKKLDVTFLCGSDPWEFFIRYSNVAQKQQITNLLQEKHANKMLTPRYPVKEDEVVACYDGSRSYRARVTTVMEKSQRVRVLDIDTNKEGMVKLSSIYSLPAEVAEIPCQVLKCCINIDEAHLKSNWTKELEIIFTETLAGSYLTVDILKTVQDGSPPKFLVNMYCWNEQLQKEINFCNWVNHKLLINMKTVVERGEDLMSSLNEASMDPFYDETETQKSVPLATLTKIAPEAACASNAVGGTTSSTEKIAKKPATFLEWALEREENGIDELDPEYINLSVQKVSTWMDKNQNQTGSYQQPKHQIMLKEPSFNSCNAESTQQTSIPIQLVEKQGQSKSPAVPHVALTDKSVGSTMSPAASEFIPKCVYIDLCNSGDTSNVISNLEEEYQPTDELRICRFFQKRGICNRVSCNKEHIQTSSKWTTDQEEVVTDAFNSIDLPYENATTFVKVQHVVNGYSFYGTLGEKYSALDGPNSRETSETLHNDLNFKDNSASHPLLKSTPAIAQVVLALGLQRSLGPKRKWQRAVVNEILDDTVVKVFFVDFGNTEAVSLSDLREIRPQFLHLPFQAVLTFLSGIKNCAGKEREATQRLSMLAKGKLLQVNVVTRDIFNRQLDVIAYSREEICLNNLLVDEGLCIPV